MPELFRLEEARLREVLEERLGCMGDLSDADDLHRLVGELAEEGVLKAPSGLEILIYPSAVEEPGRRADHGALNR